MEGEETVGNFECVTHAVDHRVTYTWHVKDFEAFYTSPKFTSPSIQSNVFGHPDDPSVHFYLQLFPKGDKEAQTSTSGEYFSFFINLDKSSDVTEMHAKYTISILGLEREIQKVTGENVFKRGSGWGRSKFMKIEELLKEKSSFLVDDMFSVRIVIEYTKTVCKPKEKSPGKILNTDTSLVLSTGNPPQFDKMLWHDITLSVGGHEIHAHRNILSASCPLLAELVSGSGTTPIIVEGVSDPDAFHQMIRFIYTGECDLTADENAYRLLALASKFRLLSLMKKCESYLLSILDKSNCYVTYSWADICSANHLKMEAAKVISDSTCSKLVVK